MATPLTQQQVEQLFQKYLDAAGRLSRASQSAADALNETADKFRKAQIAKVVKDAASKLNDTIEHTDSGLQKYLKGLNDQIIAQKQFNDTVKHLHSQDEQEQKRVITATKQFLKASLDNGKLQKVLGKEFDNWHEGVKQFIENENATIEQTQWFSRLITSHGKEFESEILKITEQLGRIDQELKKTNIGSELANALERKGGIAGALAQAFKGGGMTAFTNFLQKFFAEQLIDGIYTFTNLLIEQAAQYQKTGVQPFYKSASLLLITTVELQKIMHATKNTIFAVHGGAETFGKTLVHLRSQTMELAGMDRVEAAKLGAAAASFSTQLASSNLTAKELNERSEDYLKSVKELTRATGMEAKEIVAWHQNILDDDEIRLTLAKSTETERKNILKTIDARVLELKTMGFSDKKAKELAVSFEKLNKAATPMQRIRGAAQLGVYAAMVGFDAKKSRELQDLTRKQATLDAAGKKRLNDLQIELFEQGQKSYNKYDQALSPFADKLLEMRENLTQTIPGLKAVADIAGVEPLITKGEKRLPGEPGLAAKTAVEKGALEVGKIGGWVKGIYDFLTKETGLGSILIGGLGMLLLGGLKNIFGIIGKLGDLLSSGAGGLLRGGGGAAGGAAAGGAARFAGTAAAAGVAWGGTKAFDWALGKAGVGGNVVDEAQDEANWQRATTWEKAQSAAPRLIEHVADLLMWDNMANQARSERIANETKYLDEHGRGGAITAPTTTTTAPESTAPSPTLTATDPMGSLLALLAQSKKVQEDMAGNIAKLLQAYMDTEQQKLQKMLTGAPLVPAMARELAQ